MRLLLIKTVLICSFSLILSGCETFGGGNDASNRDDEYAGWNESEFHKQAKVAVQNENWNKAVKLYETLEARYPFGSYSAQTQLDLAFAYYKDSDNEAALAAAERFIKVNPRHPNIDYAFYLKGLVSYSRGIGFIDRYLPTDSTQRDVNSAIEAYSIFQELIRRFPNSRYVADAKQRMVALRNTIAMHELQVAKYYMKRKAYVAAVSRCNLIVKDYQRTTAVPYALQIMQEAYKEMGLTNLAENAKQVFNMNYPKGIPEMPSNTKSSVVNKIWDVIGFDD